MRSGTIALTAVLLLGLTVCVQKGPPVGEPAAPGAALQVPVRWGVGAPDTEAVVNGNNAFALDLYARLREQEGNLFCSPLSVSAALAMAYGGARGETEAQMAKALHFGLPQDRLHPAVAVLLKDLKARQKKGSYELTVANALWGQRGSGFLKEFVDLTRENYGAGFKQVDFIGANEAARKTINAWVKKETGGKIQDIIQRGAIDLLTRLVVSNAIYFKGKWGSQFEEKRTRDESFKLTGGGHVKVPMMHQDSGCLYMEGKGFQALAMPYEKGELDMVVFLPSEVDGLAEFERSFTLANLQKWSAAFGVYAVDVALPKFEITSAFGLKNALESMGMKDAFGLPAADFSGMNDKRDLFIQAVTHKAWVKVDEEGTEAAAATAVGIGCAARLPEPPRVTFHADHPFLFLIRDNRSGSILFLGRVVNPKL